MSMQTDTTLQYDIVFVYVTANECIVFNYIIHIKLCIFSNCRDAGEV